VRARARVKPIKFSDQVGCFGQGVVIVVVALQVDRRLGLVLKDPEGVDGSEVD
jgi:hypothetical protein